MADRSRELVPDTWSLVRKRKSADHWTLFGRMVFWALGCLHPKSRANGTYGHWTYSNTDEDCGYSCPCGEHSGQALVIRPFCFTPSAIFQCWCLHGQGTTWGHWSEGPSLCMYSVTRVCWGRWPGILSEEPRLRRLRPVAQWWSRPCCSQGHRGVAGSNRGPGSNLVLSLSLTRVLVMVAVSTLV